MNHRINNDFVLSIGIMSAIFIIPQILFFALALHLPHSMVIYCFLTTYTLLHLIVCFLLMEKKGMRIAAAPIHLSSIFTIIELIVCAVLLMKRTLPQVSAVILTLYGLIHFLFMAILIKTMEK